MVATAGDASADARAREGLADRRGQAPAETPSAGSCELGSASCERKSAKSADTSRRGRALLVRIGHRLDCSSLGLFNRVLTALRAGDVESVTLDMDATREVLDSGLALLMMLHSRAKRLRRCIRLVRCAPPVARRLEASGVAALFEMQAPVALGARQEALSWDTLAQAIQLIALGDAGILGLDQRGCVRFCNSGAVALLGGNMSEVLGRPWHKVLRERQPGALRRALAWLGDKASPTAAVLDPGTLLGRRLDGKECLLEVSLSRFCLQQEYGYFLSVRDVTHQIEAHTRLCRLAHQDALTGLANRELFIDRLNHAVSRHRRGATSFAVIFIDLDGFKAINDRYGHLVGDHVLCGFAERLRASLRQSDTAARFGGDEFGVILEDVADEGAATGVIDQILARLRCDPVQLDGEAVCIQASIGLAVYPKHGSRPSDLLRHADDSMYRNKRLGRRRARGKVNLLGRPRQTGAVKVAIDSVEHPV